MRPSEICLIAATIFSVSGANCASTMKTPSGPVEHADRAALSVERVEVVGQFGGLDLDLAEVLLTLRLRRGRRQRAETGRRALRTTERIRLVIVGIHDLRVKNSRRESLSHRLLLAQTLGTCLRLPAALDGSPGSRRAARRTTARRGVAAAIAATSSCSAVGSTNGRPVRAREHLVEIGRVKAPSTNSRLRQQPPEKRQRRLDAGNDVFGQRARACVRSAAGRSSAHAMSFEIIGS